MKEGASVLRAELTESDMVSSLESDVYVSFIIPIAEVSSQLELFLFRLRLAFDK